MSEQFGRLVFDLQSLKRDEELSAKSPVPRALKEQQEKKKKKKKTKNGRKRAMEEDAGKEAKDQVWAFRESGPRKEILFFLFFFGTWD